MSDTPPIGADAIRAALATMPKSPGVYRMLGAGERVLYIGKAKNLYNRVSSYAQLRDLSTRILRMVSQVVAVEHVVTQSEAEALLVEANFVRRYRPHYNILLKDDKSFPGLRIALDHPFPRIEKHRGAQTKKGAYYGPFASVNALNETLALLQKIFLLRPCADSIFANRSRPCLQYQIKRCSAPCVGYVSEAEYGAQITRAREFLEGRTREIQDHLTGEMVAASDAMEYERAGAIRDRIRALTQVQQEQGLRISGLHDADVFALARRGNRSVVMAAFYRQGSHFGQQSFKPSHSEEDSDSDIMAAFLAQFYQTHTVPREVLVGEVVASEGAAPSARGGGTMSDPADNSLATSLLATALSGQAGYRVNIHTPERGDKRGLVERLQVAANAALDRAEMENAAVQHHLIAVQKLFALPTLPVRIEVYDNSHSMGKQAVGAFIVATPEGFDKRSYRTYTIKDSIDGDDYGMMREVFRRRFGKSGFRIQDSGFSEGAASAGAEPSPLNPESRILNPDLILIDGGLGQLSAVVETFQQLGITPPPLVAIAKGQDRNAGREWFFMPGRDPFQLPPNDPTLHYLQRLRDEAHRYAIGRHRGKRAAALTHSALDDIPGIGASRKRALLLHFGSRADVERASLAELEKVEGISRKTAAAIYDYFHG